MKIILLIFYILLGYVLIFVVRKRSNNHKRLLFYQAIAFVIVVFIFLLSPVIIYKVIKPDDIYESLIDETAISCFMSFFTIFGITTFAIPFSNYLVEIVVKFHQKYNGSNLNRNPIKFLIKNHAKLKNAFIIIWFFGLLIMLSGIWFGK